ncbi:hypothetical protein TNCV_2662261 [Trichonephila clavipes]|nr:hypothetical protein TNCV_2662261 [Trichonephila clavipes]
MIADFSDLFCSRQLTVSNGKPGVETMQCVCVDIIPVGVHDVFRRVMVLLEVRFTLDFHMENAKYLSPPRQHL